jgi:hypothetical protein
MGRAVWCDAKDDGHVLDERKAITVTISSDILYFCTKHLDCAFISALNHAEKDGACGIFVPSYGGFELRSAGPRQTPRPGTGRSQEKASAAGPAARPGGGRA